MTITKRAEIDMIGYNVGEDDALKGHLEIRFAKLTFQDDALVSRELHRVALQPDSDIDEVLAAVDRDLDRMGYGTMPASDVALVKTQTDLLWTDEIRAAWAQRKADERAAAQAEQEAAARNAAKRLEPWRFWAVVNAAFPDDGLREAIKSAFADDAMKQSVALAKLDNPPGNVFDRDDPLFSDEDLMAALGLNDDSISALWQQALALPG